MPPRRSRANGTSEEGASDSSALQVELESDRLAQGLASWDTDGRQIVKDILVGQTSHDLVAASTIPLSNTSIGLLQSKATPEEVTEVLRGLAESLGEERKEILWEALVDAVAVLVEDRDDCPDLVKQEGMDVDGQAVEAPGAKGIKVVKSLLSTNTIPVAIPSLIFAPPILAELNLLPYPHDLGWFTRATTKRSTALFFKQGKYNLLRESSEGFSGLIVLLTGADSLYDRAQDETEEALKSRAKRVWSKVMGLIGYFNLSPPRVLDVILEIASCHVAIHWRFWLELIRCSPWGGAELKGGKGKAKAEGSWAEQEAEKVAGVLDWEGDRVLAQVLGAKFSFCQRPDGGDTPRGLTYIAALLLKHGFVGLADLLPFLSPDDDEMENIRKKFIESTTSRSGPVNALSSTVLADDDPPSTSNAKDAESTGPPAKPPPEQRIQLLQALLSLGDVSAAQYFLAKYPWLAQSHPAIGDLILRLIAHALEDVFRAEIPGFEDIDEDIADRNAVGDREIVPTLYAPSPPETSTKVFKFFYPGWRDGAEKWTSREDIHDKGMRWFSLVRGIGGRAGSVMAKICRIGTKHFALLKEQKRIEAGMSTNPTIKDDIRRSEPTAAEMEPWLNILRVLLLPALSNSNATAAFDIDLWALIKHFPYPVRYQLYGEWRDWICDPKRPNFNCPIAVKAAAECTRDIKKALSRVTASQSSAIPSSQERGPARALAKLSHTNPCALWSTAVTQVKAYPNIGASIVDAGRYMNQLAMDVATFTLVDVLASEKASRTNPQGTEVAQWLENIAAFVGDFNRRYLSMDLEPILQYIINKLMRGESDDLTILSRVIQRMYGVDTVENNGVSDAQLEAYATGKQMIHESFWTTQILLSKPTDDPANKSKNTPMDKAKSTKKSLPRLINALRDTKLAVPIWIALAQTRQGVVDKLVERQPDTPLKALGLMHDKVHDIFIQYGDLLGEQLTPDELVNSVPDFATLTNDFGLDYSMAFQILRSRLRAQITKEDEDKLALLREKLEAQKEASANATGTLTPPLSPTPITPPLLSTELPEKAVNGDQPDEVSVPGPKQAVERGRYQPALLPTIEQAASVLTESAQTLMGSPFFVVFWNLATSDIAFSATTYKSAINRIMAYDKEIASWRGGNLSQQKEERKRLQDRVDALAKERDAQSAYVERTRKRLRLEAPNWFDQSINEGAGRLDLAVQLHQFCFYPRALLTPSDAVFVAKMIRTMHDLGTNGFTTVAAYLQFFTDSLPACIFACTESEARNLARCLKAMLVDLDAWHQDQKKYEQEGLGDSASPLPGMMYRRKAGDDYHLMTWVAFRVFNITKLHGALYRAIKSCWEQKDFMHVKNGITVALQVLPIFPLLDDHGNDLYKTMEGLAERPDLTPDLKQGCKAYMVQLKKRITVKPYIKAEDYSPNARPQVTATASSAKIPPSGPSKAATTEESSVKPTSGAASTPAASAKLDQEALRQRVKESKARTAASAANVKEERRSAPPVAPSDSQASTGEKDDKSTAHAPPAGPRATRSSGSVPPTPGGPANGTPAKVANAPTGPSRTAPNPVLPQRPAASGSASMGPPKALTADEERAAARARRFGSLVSDSMPIRGSASPAPIANTASPARIKKEDSPMAPPASTPTNTKKEDDNQRPKSPPLPPSRKASPGPRAKRSGSVESRTSERSRRDHRDKDRERDRSGRERERDDRRGRDKQSSRATTPSASVSKSEGDRQKQEDLLQARHEKLAGEERRSSGSRRESESERADRKAKEKEEKEKDKAAKDEAGQKRKRDEAPRRIDPVERPGDRRREREREESRRDDRDRDQGRDRDRDRDRRSHRHDDSRDRDRDRRNDQPRDSRDRRDDDRRRDDPRDRDRDRDRRPGPDDRDKRPDDRDRDRERDRGRRPDDAPRELLPSGPGTAPRDGRSRPSDPPMSLSSVELMPQAKARDAPSPAPSQGSSARPDTSRGNRSNDTPVPRGPHALPARPGSRNGLNNSTNSISNSNANTSIGNTSVGSNGNGNGNGTPNRAPSRGPSGPVTPAPGSLAARMGPSLASNASRDTSPATRPASPPLPPPSAGDSERKRPNEAPSMAREGSVEAKRRKIDRDRGRVPREVGNRMLAGAMKAANDKQQE